QMETNFFVRFQREARALAKLDHPYILKVLDFGEENGMPYLVMPYVANGTLKQYTRTRLPYDRAIGIVLPIADALSYAHKRKIIHRDIKPANILFGESGEPILSDFGIAKILDSEEQVNLTGTGLGIGTPAYMAPEQWTGETLGVYTDVYALGCILYEMLSGQHVANGESISDNQAMQRRRGDVVATGSPVERFSDAGARIDEKDIRRAIEKSPHYFQAYRVAIGSGR
ncbi:MAG: serine/threonine protein kinase, partial [Chloroflexi bacterium]|nr:serine/threonine protein kinase [Chloroflexota bacterium]